MLHRIRILCMRVKHDGHYHNGQYGLGVAPDVDYIEKTFCKVEIAPVAKCTIEFQTKIISFHH